ATRGALTAAATITAWSASTGPASTAAGSSDPRSLRRVGPGLGEALAQAPVVVLSVVADGPEEEGGRGVDAGAEAAPQPRLHARDDDAPVHVFLQAVDVEPEG